MNNTIVDNSLRQKMFRCLWYAICILASVNTYQFVYSSLSFSLCSGVVILVLNVLSIFEAMRQKDSIIVHRVQWLVLAWIVFMWAHYIFVHHAEMYRLYYLTCTLSMLLTLPYLLSKGFLSGETIIRSAGFMAGIQCVCLALQKFGLLSSENPNIELTGSNENPNSTGILFMVSLPLLMQNQKRHVQILLVTLFVGLSLVIKCRTAIIGLIVYVVVMAICSNKLRFYCGKWTLMKKCLGIFCIGVLLVGVLSLLYAVKRDSSEGRLLVWRITSSMIVDNPVGAGIGLYEHDYNLKQAEYFESGIATSDEKRLAASIGTSYNDFMEHAAECGFGGLLLMLVIYATLVKLSWNQPNKNLFAVFLSVLAMSLVNFFYAAVQAWILFLGVACLVISIGRKDVRREPQKNVILSCVGLGFFITLMFGQIGHTISQISLLNYMRDVKEGKSIEITKVLFWEKPIGTSEAYWRFLSRLYYKRGDYNEALRCVLNASVYTSHPSVFITIANCYDKLGMKDKAVPYLIKGKFMLPHNLSIRLQLMESYERIGQTSEAYSIAQEIIGMPVKIETKKSIRIKKKAQLYLNHHNNENN